MRINYTNKEVFVGIDVHKKRYVAAAYCDQVVVKKWSTAASPADFVKQLNKFFPGAKIFSVYEAGFSGFVFHRILKEAGIKSIVINAASLERAPNDRVKTDRRDAKKLAQQLSARQLRCIYIPTPAQEQARLLTRHRNKLLGDRTRTANRIKSKLHQFGLISHNDETRTSLKWLESLQELDLSEELRFVLDQLVDQWKYITEKITGLKEKIAEQAKQDPKEQIYLSAPGVGSVFARELANELGDMSRFKNAKQLYSFTGLTPTERSSGDSRRQGGISYCGPARIRYALIEAAWTAIRKKGHLQATYQKIANRRGAQIAIVAIARKLIGHIRACFQTGELYQVESTI